MSYFITPFTCSSEPHGAEAISISVSGELDLATSPRLVAILKEAQHGSRVITLDLSGLSFMDCSGLHAILDTQTALDAADRSLLIVRGPPAVHRLFELSGTSWRLELVEPDRNQPGIEAFPRIPTTGVIEQFVRASRIGPEVGR